MHLPAFHKHPKPAAKAPAPVRVPAREDVLWNRPVFRAPPLHITPPPAPVSPGELREHAECAH